MRYIGDGSGPENFAPGWDKDGNLADPAQFHGWLQNVVVPYIDHCRADGLYVVLVGNPSEAFPGGDKTRNMTRQYQQNLMAFWTAVASFPGIKNASNVMFEICNEPIAIESSFGANDWRSGNDACWSALAGFMRPIARAIRAQGANNVVWVPALGWEGEGAGFAAHPIDHVANIGYALHLYPAYGNAHDDPALIQKLWDTNYRPCAHSWPVIITEMVWDPNDGQGYKGLWNGTTAGFGDAIHSLIDSAGNVSYLVGMVGDDLPNLNAGLSAAALPTTEGGRAAFDWFASYTASEPGRPMSHGTPRKPSAH